MCSGCVTWSWHPCPFQVHPLFTLAVGDFILSCTWLFGGIVWLVNQSTTASSLGLCYVLAIATLVSEEEKRWRRRKRERERERERGGRGLETAKNRNEMKQEMKVSRCKARWTQSRLVVSLEIPPSTFVPYVFFAAVWSIAANLGILCNSLHSIQWNGLNLQFKVHFNGEREREEKEREGEKEREREGGRERGEGGFVTSKKQIQWRTSKDGACFGGVAKFVKCEENAGILNQQHSKLVLWTQRTC